MQIELLQRQRSLRADASVGRTVAVARTFCDSTVQGSPPDADNGISVARDGPGKPVALVPGLVVRGSPDPAQRSDRRSPMLRPGPRETYGRRNVWGQETHAHRI